MVTSGRPARLVVVRDGILVACTLFLFHAFARWLVLWHFRWGTILLYVSGQGGGRSAIYDTFF